MAYAGVVGKVVWGVGRTMSDAVNDGFGNMEWQDDGRGSLLDADREGLVGIVELKDALELVEISDAECDEIYERGWSADWPEHVAIATRRRVEYVHEEV